MNQTVFLFPNIPTVNPVLKDGTWHPAWQQWFQQVTTIIQNNLSPQGFILPQQPTTTIKQLNTAASKGAMIYDETTNEVKINIDGTFKVMNVT
jgi:hypothetical protein